MCHVLCDRGQSGHPNSVDQELPAKSSSRSNYRGRVVSPHLVLGILFFVIMADSNQKQSCCDSKLKFWNDSGFAAIKFMRLLSQSNQPRDNKQWNRYYDRGPTLTPPGQQPEPSQDGANNGSQYIDRICSPCLTRIPQRPGINEHRSKKTGEGTKKHDRCESHCPKLVGANSQGK